MQSEGGTEMSVENVFLIYGDMLYRISLVMLQNVQDAEDAVSDTLIKYMLHRKSFQDEAHCKAWLIRVNINLCKNKLIFRKRHPQIQLEQLGLHYQEEESRLMGMLMELPQTYREVVLLYYIEGYKIREIAKILRLTESTVKKRLERARKQLKEDLADGI